ncbi:MAG TPA: SNF2-related protein, partial [Candidatus Limnocylindria bacterium]|nr:SNF2-related protein [Candidatus Limnocylindria bacterium]
MLAGLLEPVESALTAEPLPDWLLPHQADAVLRARGILARFGGVLVADGVGLGKTFIGLALAALERARGGGATAFVPAATAPEWRAAASSVGVSLVVHSHTTLARRVPSLPDRCTLLVVDEAHAFRNPRTLRYDALARLTAGRRVALLSATPLNNSPADLEALVHLFASRDRFREFGVPDLGSALRDSASSAALALGAISVCRTRRLIEERFPELRG